MASTQYAQAIRGCMDDGVVLSWYIGPADVLCRVLAGDVITAHDFVADQSPFVRTLIHAGIVDRIRFMAQIGAPAGG